MNNNTIYIQSNKDYLMHYGVPGMKWGRRKDRRGGLPGKRKIKRQIKEANKSPQNNRNIIKVQKKIGKEFSKTEEYKQLDSSLKFLNFAVKEAQKAGYKSVRASKEYADAHNKLVDNAQKRYNSIVKKYINEAAGATLKDLGYKDTKAGRDYLIKKKLV